MLFNKRIFVIGGDMRIGKMAESLKSRGFAVLGFALPDAGEIIEQANSIDDGLSSADIVVLGLPASTDGETVSAPFYNKKILLGDLIPKMNKNQVFLGGRLNHFITSLLDEYEIKWEDYLKREELAVLNAVPTAEGAIEIAMSEMPITLSGSKCLVVGFGRIGKCLAKMLFGIGAKVSVSARKHSDLAWIKSLGYEGLHTQEISSVADKYDLIINTVPHKLIGASVINKIKKDALVIDLASKPGGVDMDAAAEKGIRVIWALSLPGKVAPLTAGEIICDTVTNIINELGV